MKCRVEDMINKVSDYEGFVRIEYISPIATFWMNIKSENIEHHNNTLMVSNDLADLTQMEFALATNGMEVNHITDDSLDVYTIKDKTCEVYFIMERE